MLADEMRKAAGDAIQRVGAAYQEQAFMALANGNIDMAKELAAKAVAWVDYARAAEKALRRAAEEEDA